MIRSHSRYVGGSIHPGRESRPMSEYKKYATSRQRELASRARVPFGPYRGQRVVSVPRDYLAWLLPFTVGDFEKVLRMFLGVKEDVAQVDDGGDEA